MTLKMLAPTEKRVLGFDFSLRVKGLLSLIKS